MKVPCLGGGLCSLSALVQTYTNGVTRKVVTTDLLNEATAYGCGATTYFVFNSLFLYLVHSSIEMVPNVNMLL